MGKMNMPAMKRKVNDGKEEDGGPPESDDRRSGQRVGDRQRSGRGAASALSRLKMLERRYQLPAAPEGREKS
jgi:hypothetical protein